MLTATPPVIRHRNLMKRRANATVLAPTHLREGYRLRYSPEPGKPCWVEPESGMRWSREDVQEHPDTAALAALSWAQWKVLRPLAADVRRAEFEITAHANERTLLALAERALVEGHLGGHLIPGFWPQLTELGKRVVLLVDEHERICDHLDQGLPVITAKPTPTKRTGVEQFTGEFQPVAWSQERADSGLPPWASTVDAQFFTDSEVKENTPG